MPTVTIAIVNWNGERYVEACLSSVLAQTYQDFEVVLVDNGSQDGSLALMKSRFPEVHLVCNQRNLGFAAANNQAIRLSQSTYIATLNNDTVVEPAWLGEMVRTIETSPNVGMCASKMLFKRNPGVINSTGISLDWAGIAWDRGGGDLDSPKEPAPIEAFGPCAGAALYRRRMLDEIGLFDEDFFAYLEDVDLAWRARLRGWRCLYAPTARVYHAHSGTAVEGSAFKNYLLGRNKVFTIVKNYPAPQLCLLLPLILLYDAMFLVYALLARGDAVPIKGRLAGLRRLPRLWSKRKEVQGSRTASVGEMTRLMSPPPGPRELRKRLQHLRELRGLLTQEKGEATIQLE